MFKEKRTKFYRFVSLSLFFVKPIFPELFVKLDDLYLKCLN